MLSFRVIKPISMKLASNPTSPLFKPTSSSISFFNIVKRHQSTTNTSSSQPLSSSTTTATTTESYPSVPKETYFNRSPDITYFDQQNRRDFNEPLHPDDDVLNLWSPYTYAEIVDDSTAVKWQMMFFGSLALFAGFCYWFTGGKPQRKAVPRQYPDGLKRDLGGEINSVYEDKTFYQ